MILCRSCYIAIEGDEWFPADIGRFICDECGEESQECYEIEDEAEEE